MNAQLDDRLTRTRWVIDGLSVGDAFGDRLFFQGFSQYSDSFETMVQKRILPAPLWEYTDDTQMALSIVECLATIRITRDDKRCPLAALVPDHYTKPPESMNWGIVNDVYRCPSEATDERKTKRPDARTSGGQSEH